MTMSQAVPLLIQVEQTNTHDVDKVPRESKTRVVKITKMKRNKLLRSL